MSVQKTGRGWYYCSAPGCTSDDRKRGRYGYMASVEFFPFPSKLKAPTQHKKWIELLRRADFEPNRKSRVCSLHFVDGKPTERHPFPELFEYNNFKESEKIRPSVSILKRQQATASVLSTICRNENQQTTNEPEETYAVEFGVPSQSELLEGCWPVAKEVTLSETHIRNAVPAFALEHNYSGDERHMYIETKDSSTQTELTMADLESLEQQKIRLDNPEKLLQDLVVQKITKDDTSVHQYTGIPSKKMLNGIFDILDRSSPYLKYWSGQETSTEKNYQTNFTKKTGPKRKLPRFQEFILTLVRLRLALHTFVLADLFGVSSSRVSQIFTTWINFMALIFTPLLKWPSQKVVKKFRPLSFKLKYPNVTGIIDCNELFIQRPKNPTAQSQTFSTYKQTNTYKCLVCISPSGAITYISNLWGGNASDRHITKESGFLELIRPGDEIMADRGFVIRDLLTKKRAKLIIPPFTKRCSWGKKKRLSASDIIKTRSIAKFRIHVERAIGRLKTFKLLSTTMPLNLKPLANPMLKVSPFICNLHKPLVKK